MTFHNGYKAQISYGNLITFQKQKRNQLTKSYKIIVQQKTFRISNENLIRKRHCKMRKISSGNRMKKLRSKPQQHLTRTSHNDLKIRQSHTKISRNPSRIQKHQISCGNLKKVEKYKISSANSHKINLEQKACTLSKKSQKKYHAAKSRKSHNDPKQIIKIPLENLERTTCSTTHAVAKELSRIRWMQSSLTVKTKKEGE
jgi:hypothetical protein